jgi:hypothetical protein
MYIQAEVGCYPDSPGGKLVLRIVAVKCFVNPDKYLLGDVADLIFVIHLIIYNAKNQPFVSGHKLFKILLPP